MLCAWKSGVWYSVKCGDTPDSQFMLVLYKHLNN